MKCTGARTHWTPEQEGKLLSMLSNPNIATPSDHSDGKRRTLVKDVDKNMGKIVLKQIE